MPINEHTPQDTLDSLMDEYKQLDAQRKTTGWGERDTEMAAYMAKLETQISITKKTVLAPLDAYRVQTTTLADRLNYTGRNPLVKLASLVLGRLVKTRYEQSAFRKQWTLDGLEIDTSMDELYRLGFVCNSEKKGIMELKPADEVRAFSDAEVQEVLSSPYLFGDMNMVDRYGFMQGLGQFISKDLGIDCPQIHLNANIVIEGALHGASEVKDARVLISPRELYGLGYMLNTLSHELRHQWQKGKDYIYEDGSKVGFVESIRSKPYKVTSRHRDNITGEVYREFHLGYRLAPAEVDAREYARSMNKKYNIDTHFEAGISEEQNVAAAAIEILNGETTLNGALSQETRKAVIKNAQEFLVKYPLQQSVLWQEAFNGIFKDKVAQMGKMLMPDNELAQAKEKAALREPKQGGDLR
ncbi:MAG: hypothetical protein LBL34_06905 [Clostridiales bacterium]|jgi:hypothetical protein|nr:hypothetical protein [Clostridiales bacterium]